MSQETYTYNYTTIENRRSKENSAMSHLAVYEKSLFPYTNSTVMFGINSSGDHVALKISGLKWGARREWQGLQMAFDNGVPTPEPYELIQADDGRMGIVSQKIDGVNLYTNTNPALKFVYGDTISGMHQNVPITGDEWKKSGKADFTYYDRLMTDWLRMGYKQLKKDGKAQVLLTKFALAIHDQFDGLKPAFTHQDLHNDQALVTSTGKVYVLDFELWREDAPLDDLAMYLLHSLRTKTPRQDFVEFAKGYIKGGNFSENDKAMISFFLLFNGSRGIDFFSRFKPNDLQSAINQLNKIIQYIDTEQLWKEL